MYKLLENFEYVILLLFLACFVLGKLYLMLALAVLWYLLYGFVGLAERMIQTGHRRLAQFYLKVTFPYLLLPFRRAWYYMLSILALPAEPVYPADTALALSRKLNPEALGNDNNRSYYYGIVAHIQTELGNVPEARTQLEKARALKHNAGFDKLYQDIEERILKKEQSA